MIALFRRLRKWLTPCDCWCCEEAASHGWWAAIEGITIARRSEDDQATFHQKKLAHGEALCPAGGEAHGEALSCPSCGAVL